MKFVDDIRHAYKWLSLRIAAFHAAVVAVWLGTPDDLKPVLPDEWMLAFTLAMLFFGALGRAVKQDIKDD